VIPVVMLQKQKIILGVAQDNIVFFLCLFISGMIYFLRGKGITRFARDPFGSAIQHLHEPFRFFYFPSVPYKSKLLTVLR
jgi:hypothetical protein